METKKEKAQVVYKSADEKLLAQLEEFHRKEADINRKIDERNGNKTLHCGGCNKYHRIKDLTLIQTHFYVPPYGCTEGAYWSEGEMRFVCSETKIENRLLFDNNDIDWKDREKYEKNPKMQFERNYKRLFKKIIDTYDREESRTLNWVNNYYVDENRKKFGLVGKKK